MNFSESFLDKDAFEYFDELEAYLKEGSSPALLAAICIADSFCRGAACGHWLGELLQPTGFGIKRRDTLALCSFSMFTEGDKSFVPDGIDEVRQVFSDPTDFVSFIRACQFRWQLNLYETVTALDAGIFGTVQAAFKDENPVISLRKDFMRAADALGFGKAYEEIPYWNINVQYDHLGLPPIYNHKKTYVEIAKYYDSKDPEDYVLCAMGLGEDDKARTHARKNLAYLWSNLPEDALEERIYYALVLQTFGVDTHELFPDVARDSDVYFRAAARLRASHQFVTRAQKNDKFERLFNEVDDLTDELHRLFDIREDRWRSNQKYVNAPQNQIYEWGLFGQKVGKPDLDIYASFVAGAIYDRKDLVEKAHALYDARYGRSLASIQKNLADQIDAISEKERKQEEIEKEYERESRKLYAWSHPEDESVTKEELLAILEETDQPLEAALKEMMQMVKGEPYASWLVSDERLE